MAETKTPEAILQDALTAAQEKYEVLLGDLTAERAAHGKTEQALRDAETLIDQLNQQLGQAAAAKPALPTVEHEGSTYRVVVPKFRLAGFDILKAEELASQPEAVAALVKAGSKVLELVVE